VDLLDFFLPGNNYHTLVFFLHKSQKKNENGFVCRQRIRGCFSLQKILPPPVPGLGVLLDQLLQLVGVGPHQLRDLGVALHEDEGWHGADVELLCGVLGLVNVDLEEDDVFVGLGHFLDLGRDHLAGAAPRREEIDHDKFVSGIVELLLELGKI